MSETARHHNHLFATCPYLPSASRVVFSKQNKICPISKVELPIWPSQLWKAWAPGSQHGEARGDMRPSQPGCGFRKVSLLQRRTQPRETKASTEMAFHLPASLHFSGWLVPPASGSMGVFGWREFSQPEPLKEGLRGPPRSPARAALPAGWWDPPVNLGRREQLALAALPRP